MFKTLSLCFFLPVGIGFILYIFPQFEDEDQTTMNSKQNYILAAALISVPLLSYYIVHRRRSLTQLTDTGGLELLKALASSTSSIETVRQILARYPSSIKNVFDSHLNTPLLLALHNGKPEVAYLLLGVSSISQLDSNTLKNLAKQHRNDMRWSLLHSASYGECVSFIEDLLLACNSHFSSSTSPFLIDDADIAGWTPLVIATSKGNTNLVKLLISRGANPNTNTSQDLSPVMIASNNGYLDIVKELLLHDVDLTVQSAASLETALHMAIKNKRTEIALLLLAIASHNVSSLLSIANKTGSTPLHVAAFIGDILLVEELLRLGSDANATRGDGFTALHLTCVQNHLDIAKRLVPCTDVDSESRFGTTALHEASRRGFHKLVALLLQNGADPNKEDNDQMGPLHADCSGVNVFFKKKEEDKKEDKQDEDINHLEVAELLIRHGANVNKLDRGGSTVLHITACGGPAGKHLMSRLLEAGVDLTLENYIGWTALHFALDFERTAKSSNPVVEIIKVSLPSLPLFFLLYFLTVLSFLRYLKNFARENVPNFLETVDEMKPRAQRKLVPEGISISSEPKISLENVVSSLRAGIYQKVIVLTGAGVSVSAGIPDFRR
jgi:ankyrin repeat protein